VPTSFCWSLEELLLFSFLLGGQVPAAHPGHAEWRLPSLAARSSRTFPARDFGDFGHLLLYGDPVALLVEDIHFGTATAGIGVEVRRRDQGGLLADEPGARLGGDPGVRDLIGSRLQRRLLLAIDNGQEAGIFHPTFHELLGNLLGILLGVDVGGRSFGDLFDLLGGQVDRGARERPPGQRQAECRRQADHDFLAVPKPQILDLLHRRVGHDGFSAPDKMM